jgi:5-formyltetrahydrofolate cyclo-ligase
VLRAAALARRDALSPRERADASETIAARCRSIVRRAARRRIAGYVPIGSEFDPSAVLRAAHAAGAVLALPAVTGPTAIVFRRWEPGETLISGRFGTRAPPLAAPLVEPDLVLVPLVGFDRSGARLGYGRGFYDRALGAIHARGRRPTLVGLAFSVQEVPRIPHEPHDIRLDWVVTETETLDFTAKSA